MKSKQNEENREFPPKVRFSIGAKLVTIITILVLVSLGTITVLVSALISEDVKINAEENNFETNRRSAAVAENILENIKANAVVLIQVMNASGGDSALARQASLFFFEQNQNIAALTLFTQEGEEQLLINERFFLSEGIDISLPLSFYETNRANLDRAATGEVVLLNAAPHFEAPILAMAFSWEDGKMGSVLFSSESLNNTFSHGINQSYLINGNGDILVHANFDLVLAGANIANRSFIRSMRENPALNMQDLVPILPEDEIIENTNFASMVVDYADVERLTGESPEASTPVGLIGRIFTSLREKIARFIPALSTEPKEKLYYIAFTKINLGASLFITSIEYNKVFEGIVATTRRNAYLTAAILSLSILFIWFFSKRISVPLKLLASAAHTIEGGVFEVEFDLKSRDEVGLLGASFKRMSSALGIFGKFTNKEIAVRAMRGEIKPGGFPKQATIFFSDIRGFTEKSEAITNEFGDDASNHIVSWLNNYFSNMVECIEKTNGTVDKFIGDAILAHWGTVYTEGSPRKDAFNCIKAALLMRMALLRMNHGRESDDRKNPRIQIGCGINTGIVTAGQIGSDLRMEYTVIGDPVNLASRTEELNKTFGTDILITENTWNLVNEYFITEEMLPVKVKGKSKPVRMFAVINLKSSTVGPHTLPELRELMGIKTPDLTKVDFDSLEKKYIFAGLG